MSSEWVMLFLAIIMEASGTTMMKLSRGFTRLAPTIAMFVLYLGGLIPLNLALRRIEISVAYAIWSGVGTVFITIIGIIFFKEHVSPIKLISIALVILGVIGLELSQGRIR